MQKKLMSPPRLIAVSYLFTIIIGTILLSLPLATNDNYGLSLIDAFFTATSATCVTGLIVVNTAQDLSLFGQILVMIMIQIGGLGLMTFATLLSLILGKKITFKGRLIMQEALNQITLAGIIGLTKKILLFTLIAELVGGILLALCWFPQWGLKSIYYGIFHSISAFNNAGFDIFGNNLESFKSDGWTNLIILTLFISGGLGFTVIAEIYSKGISNFKSYSLHSKMVLIITAILLFIGFMAVLIFEFNNSKTIGSLSFGEKMLIAFFQGATPRTAGFNTIPLDNMEIPTLVFIIVLMFIGASPASTGGGIKTTTFGTIILAVLATIKGEEEIVFKGRKIPNSNILKALAIILIGIVEIMVITLILTMTENLPFLDLVFEIVSAFSTVGLSTGITPQLSGVGKIALIFTMFTGRVGPLTLAFAFTKQYKGPQIGYPEEKVIIG